MKIQTQLVDQVTRAGKSNIIFTVGQMITDLEDHVCRGKTYATYTNTN